MTDFGTDNTDAAVACRQLGFTGGSDLGTLSSSPCPGCGGRIYSIGCTGDEIRLVECTHTTDGSSSSGAYINCSTTP